MPTKVNRKYGRKKPSVLDASSALFSTRSPSIDRLDEPKEKTQTPNIVHDVSFKNEISFEKPSLPISPVFESELAGALAGLDLADASTKTFGNVERSLSNSASADLIQHLQSLLHLAQADNLPISLESWTSILPVNSVLTKIAEASYAEVYRITTSSATSIVKIMPLKHPADPASMARTFASTISDVIPELKIMNVLTEIPGFVTFKSAKLVTGNQSHDFVQAWEVWGRRDEYIPEDGWLWNSEFEHPLEYGEDAVFLAIELGDAGEVLEDMIIDTPEKVWDVWLGAVIALARAEAVHEFEHRDMHENNICVYPHPKHKTDTNTNAMFGRSGLEVTIIDYGLSRATLSNDFVTFKDLEADLEIFRGRRWHRQFETYRQMRSHLYTSTLEQLPVSWHKNDQSAEWMLEAEKSWEDYIPQTNVMWLSYLLDYLKTQYTAHGPLKKKSLNKAQIELQFAELKVWLDFDPRSSIIDGERFISAGECLDFCVELGWIDEDQLNGDTLPSEETIGERYPFHALEMRNKGIAESPRVGRYVSTKAKTEGNTVVERQNIGAPSTPFTRTQTAVPQHTFFSTPVEAALPRSTRVLRSRTPSPVKSITIPDPVKLLTSSHKPSKTNENVRNSSKERARQKPGTGTNSTLDTKESKSGRNLRSRKKVDD